MQGGRSWLAPLLVNRWLYWVPCWSLLLYASGRECRACDQIAWWSRRNFQGGRVNDTEFERDLGIMQALDLAWKLHHILTKSIFMSILLLFFLVAIHELFQMLWLRKCLNLILLDFFYPIIWCSNKSNCCGNNMKPSPSPKSPEFTPWNTTTTAAQLKSGSSYTVPVQTLILMIPTVLLAWPPMLPLQQKRHRRWSNHWLCAGLENASYCESSSNGWLYTFGCCVWSL